MVPDSFRTRFFGGRDNILQTFDLTFFGGDIFGQRLIQTKSAVDPSFSKGVFRRYSRPSYAPEGLDHPEMSELMAGLIG